MKNKILIFSILLLSSNIQFAADKADKNPSSQTELSTVPLTPDAAASAVAGAGSGESTVPTQQQSTVASLLSYLWPFGRQSSVPAKTTSEKAAQTSEEPAKESKESKKTEPAK